AGTRIALLSIEPLATAQTTGSSRRGSTPATCCALSARSSPRTPAVFLAAILVITATSSSTVAISSSSVSRLEATLSPGAENARCTRFERQREHQRRGVHQTPCLQYS